MASTSTASNNRGGPKGITLQKYRGTLSLLGPEIDDFARSNLYQAQISDTNISIPIPQHHDHHREHPYHITFLTKDELRSLSSEHLNRVDALLRSSSSSPSSSASKSSVSHLPNVDFDLDTNNIFPLGVGSSSFSSVYWTVIIWATGQKLRKLLSLPPKHFHITLSSGPDIHDPPKGKGVESLLVPLDFSFLSPSPSSSSSNPNADADANTTTKIFDGLSPTHLDHLTFTLHIFHSYDLAQQCATALILKLQDDSEGKATGRQHKGFLRYADACWALRKYKLAILAYGCVWERVAFALRVQKRRKNENMRARAENESDVNNNDEDEEVKAQKKIQAYALKKLAECARHTEWGHVFRPDEMADVLSPHPLLHDDLRTQLMRVWGEELRGVICRLVDKRGMAEGDQESGGWVEDTEKENTPRSALFIPIFTIHPHQKQETKKTKFEFEFYRLPRFFSWVVPFHLALMSTPKSHEDIRALASSALGIRRVLTLTEEEKLPVKWFGKSRGGGGRERDIVNTFIPVKNECPPSIEQMDCVVRLFVQDEVEDEEEANEYDDDKENEEEQEYDDIYIERMESKRKKRNTPMLIHCGGGKGRAGTVAACYLVSFGFGRPPRSTSPDENENTQRPRMSSQAAITTLRAMRPGSLETSIQERFVSEWASTIWKRRSVFPPSGEQEPVNMSLTGGKDFEVEGSLVDLNTGNTGSDPLLIILVGLPGAGKSWFAKALMARDPGGWVYVSQDEIGSRDICERVVARGPLPHRASGMGMGTGKPTPTDPLPANTTGHRGLILDRCNPTIEDRKGWIALARTWTDKVLYVHFDYRPELCESRAQRRVEHPTLQPGGRVRAAVKAMSDVFEVPSVDFGGGGKGKGKGKGKEAEKGVKAIVRIRSLAGAREAVVLVDGLGRRGGGNGGGGGVVMKFPRTPHLMDLGGAGGDDVWVEGGVDGFMHGARGLGPSSTVEAKMAKTKIQDSSEEVEKEEPAAEEGEETGQEPEKEDGRWTSESSVPRPPTTPRSMIIPRRRKTLITEKLDGANMGFLLSPDGTTILVQNRSHYITSNSHAQFRKLDAWLARCGEGVRQVLLWPGADVDAESGLDGAGWFPDRCILYGEWMAARHSVGYTRLEDWFVAFDLYDRVGGLKRRGGFVDGETLRRRCGAGGIICAPVLFETEGGEVPGEEVLVRMVGEKSMCGEERREGVVIKIEEWYGDGDGDEVGWVRARGKIVRGDFIPGNDHWTKGQLVFNRLREDY